MSVIPSKREGQLFGIFVRWMFCSWDQVLVEVSTGEYALWTDAVQSKIQVGNLAWWTKNTAQGFGFLEIFVNRFGAFQILSAF